MNDIETEFFILSQEQYDEFSEHAKNFNVNLDYYLLEFCFMHDDVIDYEVS